MKPFYGTSSNAVQTQFWIAVTTYVLVVIVRERLEIEWDLYTILQILSVYAFKKAPLAQVLSEAGFTPGSSDTHNHWSSFDL